MLLLRSALFNLLFYVNIALWALLCVPALLMPRRTAMGIVQAWCRSSLWLTRRVAGIRVEFRGLERIPPGGLLVASKHQSFLETFALIAVLDDPAFILKRELMWIPLVGWFLAKIGMVPVNRGARSLALVEMNRRARAEAAKGRQILIFPEGTRRPPGAEPAYKYGVAHLYLSLGVPCVPVAINAGLFWPRRSFLRRPGTALIEFGEPIPPGLDRDAAFSEMRRRIEAGSRRLLAEGHATGGEAAPVPMEGEAPDPRARP
jgi:1-acyl-sn-glycerol-3-phosphate acyltransferase